MKPDLTTFSEKEYQSLFASGMLWEFYPEATGNYFHDVLSANKTEEEDIEELTWEMESSCGKRLKMVNTEASIDDFISKISIIYKSLGFKNDLLIKAIGVDAASNRHYIIRPDGTDTTVE